MPTDSYLGQPRIPVPDETLDRSKPETMTHALNCAGSHWDGDCTCGLNVRIALATEKTMHAAWRKRAEEAEADLRAIRSAAETPSSNERVTDAGLRHALREASAKFDWLAEHHVSSDFARQACKDLAHKMWNIQSGAQSSDETLVEPTPEMIQQGIWAWTRNERASTAEDVRAIYMAMRRMEGRQAPESQGYAGDSIAKLIADMTGAAQAARANHRDGVAVFVGQWIERLQALVSATPTKSAVQHRPKCMVYWGEPICTCGAAETKEPHPDTSRVDWLLANISGAEWRRLGIVYSGGMNRTALNDAMARLPEKTKPPQSEDDAHA